MSNDQKNSILTAFLVGIFLFCPSASFCAETSATASDPKVIKETKEVPPIKVPAANEQADKDHPQKTSYVYDLRSLIEKSRNNIKRVNEKIKEQAIYKRNLQREEKAREYYDRAMVLFDEGKIDEARELFEKSIRITEHPEMKDYIKLSEKKFKNQAQAMRKEEQERLSQTIEQERERQQQVRKAYEDGERLYKQQNYKAARDEFVLVEQLIPEYKATRSYLKLVEEKIAQQDRVDLVNQKKEIARQQKEAEAARSKEKDLWHKELELKEQERQRKLGDQAKKVYAEAMSLYKEKKFIAAKEKFQEVEWVMPDYRSTRRYLEQLDKDIKDSEATFNQKEKEQRAKQDWNDEITRKKAEAQAKKEFEEKSAEDKHKAAQEASVHYQTGTDLLGQKKYAEARDEFLAVQKIYPDFKGTSTYLARLNNEMGIIETAPDKVADLVRGIYAKALEDYNRKDFGAAKLKFEQVEFMYPDYMATRKYLDKLAKQDAQAAQTQGSEKKDKDEPAVKDVPVKVGPEVDTSGYAELAEKVEPLYAKAVALFDEKKFDEALKQFEEVEKILPNYQATRPYLKRVSHQIKKNEQLRYKEEQIAQAETINLLAKQANSLYTKISQLADDRSMSEAQRKFALVDRLFANMSKEQAKLLAEIAEEEEKLRLEEIAYEQEVQRSEFVNAIDPIYQEAVRLYQARKYDEAKAKFLEAQSKISDYRSSKRYLGLIEKQNQLLQQTIKDRESQIVQFQNKAAENAELATKLQLKAQESAMINDLVEQAESINDEIVALSKDRNFEAIKEKFAQLEKIVDSLLTIKAAAVERDTKEKAERQKRIDEEKQLAEAKKAQEKAAAKSDDSKKDVPAPADSPKASPEKTPEMTDAKETKEPKQQSESERDKLRKEKAAERKKAQQEKRAAKARKAAEEKAAREKAVKEKADAEAAKKATIVPVEAIKSETSKAAEATQESVKTENISKEPSDKSQDDKRTEDVKKEIELKKKQQQEKDAAKQEAIRAKEAKKKEERERAVQKKADLQKQLEEKRRIEREKANQAFKLRQIDQENREAYQRAVASYYAKNFPDAKARFIRLEQNAKYGASSRKYVEKIDAIILEQQNQVVIKQEKERAEYVEERAERERMSFKVQEANRDNKVQAPKASQYIAPAVVPTQQFPTTRQQYLNSLNLRVRKSPVEEISDQKQVSQMKEVPQAAPPAPEPAPAVAPSKETASAGMSPNEDASWIKRHNQKKLSDRRKKYFDDKRKEQEKREAQLKRKADDRNNELLRKKEAQKIANQAKAEAQKKESLRIKDAYRANKRQVSQEKKLRNFYQNELRTSSDGGFDKAMAALENEKIRDKRFEAERQKDFLRQQREEEKQLRKEKERKINTIINQGESSKFPGRSDRNVSSERKPLPQAEAPAERVSEKNAPVDSDAKYTVKVSKQQIPSKASPKEPAAMETSPRKAKTYQDGPDKEIMRKKFESGLAKMYAEGLAYYRKHMYKEARDRFTDVEDISPDYKRTRSYLSSIEADILKEQKRREKVREESKYNSIQPTDIPRIQKINSMPGSPAVVTERVDTVSQALDDFEAKSQ